MLNAQTIIVNGISCTVRLENCWLISSDQITPSDRSGAATVLIISSIVDARLKLKKTVLINRISRNSTMMAPAPDITVRNAGTLFLYKCPMTIAGIKKYTA
ncbi:hypothetical protein D3C76_1434530 [compost metagenome]